MVEDSCCDTAVVAAERAELRLRVEISELLAKANARLGLSIVLIQPLIRL